MTTTIETEQIQLWGRIAVSIYVDKKIAKNEGAEKGLREAFDSKRVFPAKHGESYLVGDLVDEIQEDEDITHQMLGLDEEGYSDELVCPDFIKDVPEDLDESKYYSFFGRIGCTIFVDKQTVMEKGLEAALHEAFERNLIIADGESYVPDEPYIDEDEDDEDEFEDDDEDEDEDEAEVEGEVNVKDFLKNLFGDKSWEFDEYIPDNWTFK